MLNYGVKFYIPSLYVIDAKILRLREGFILQAVKYVIPVKDKHENLPQLITHKFDSAEPTIDTYEQLYQPYIGNVVIRILKRKSDSGIEKLDEEFLIEKADSAMIKVSMNKDVNYVAIYYYRNTVSHGHEHEAAHQFIEVYKIEEEDLQDPILLIKKMKQRKWHRYYSSIEAADMYDHHHNHAEREKNTNISFIKDLQFDNEMKYLIGYGGTSFFTLDLTVEQKDLLKIHHINQTEFDSILHMQFTSGSGNK